MFSFLHVDPYLGDLYITWKVSTRNRGLNSKNTLCTPCLWGCGFQPVFFSIFNIFDYKALFDLPNYWSGSWRRYSKSYPLVCLWRRGELVCPGGKQLAWWKSCLGTGSRRKLCTVPITVVIFMGLGGAKR